MSNLVLLVFTAVALSLCGVNWFVQVVHHPLSPQVGREAFAADETAYNRLRGPVIFLPTFVALLGAVALLFVRPAAVPPGLVLVVLALLAVTLVSTVVLQAPQHVTLARGFDEGAYRTLLRSSWIRTAAWTLTGLTALLMVARTM